MIRMTSQPFHIRLLQFFLLHLLAATSLQAQQTVVYSPEIGHVSVAVNGDEARLPVLTLGSADRLTIAFDDLTPEYRRFTWRMEHCAYDWQTTDGLFESEYMANSPMEAPIEGYEQSSLTATLYTHYTIHIGGMRRNAVRPLISGNYRVSVFGEDDDEKPVFTACFIVVEPQAKLAAQATTDTDIDYRRSHQQLAVTAEMGSLRLINPTEEVRLSCVQNRSPHFTIHAPRPTYIMGSTLRWEHCHALIFPAGNEYRKFEMPSTRIPGMHIDRLRHDGEGYTALLQPDVPRRDYFFDEDQNGRNLVYTERSNNADTEADYVLTRFTLASEEIPNAEVYVDGRWTDGSEAYRMHYNPETGSYEADILLKQGYYSYRYLVIEPKSDSNTLIDNIDGNYYQTENEYTIYLYYRPAGTRYWQLVAIQHFNYRP